MSPPKALLIDLSGTLHIGKAATANAVEALGKLQSAGVPFRLASNTTKESKANLLARLSDIGFKDIRPEHLITSLSATADAVVKDGLNPLLLLTDSAKADFPAVSMSSASEHDSVVVGLAPDKLDYNHLNAAFRILSQDFGNKRPRLLATHKATYYRAEDGGLSLGPGPFITALEQAAETEAQVFGKPSKSFYELCLRSLEADGISQHQWSEVAVVGDDIKNDLGGAAIELALQRILVRTGKYQAGDERKVNPGEQLTGIEDNFASLIQRLLH